MAPRKYNFSHFAKHRLLKKKRFVATLLLTLNWFFLFKLVFFETNIDVEQKQNSKSEKKKTQR